MISLTGPFADSTLCNCCKPKKIARQVAKRACCYTLQPTCNLSRIAIVTQVAKKITPCNTSYGARLYFLQRYAIPKINMLHNLNCCETRFRLLCRRYLLHSSLNLAFRQCKLHNIFIFGMAYCRGFL